MKYLFCNLKNRMVKDEFLVYQEYIKKINQENLIIFPANVFLSLADDSLNIGAQDISSIIDEIVTGEITGKQLKSMNVKYVIIGHSERRIFKQEKNLDFINKINACNEEDFKVIYCIGETLKQRENKETYQILEKEICEVLNNVDLKNIIIAYEPVWAIGTGEVPEILEIKDKIIFIKDLIEEIYDKEIPVIYGGSVNENNIAELNQIKSLDGFLVGGASLEPIKVEKMLKIIS
ncbi:MAG: triosephosphate isomerase [Firmicutes bacterium]|nr:triosephosphate isomerase [Bacillota bacterium]